MKNRKIAASVSSLSQKKIGRIIVFTGARQTGKTTLARKLFSDYRYLSIEDPVTRQEYKKLTAAQWHLLFPKAVLDEVQKESVLVESIKSAYDQFPDVRYILLGSSQLLLLEKVKESLAGRCSIIELFPLTVPEIQTSDWEEPVRDSPFQSYLNDHRRFSFIPSFLLDSSLATKQAAWDFYAQYGGYPALCDDTMSRDDRYTWLKNYAATYLQRDIRDMANFRDFEPFVKLQKYLALQTGGILNLTHAANQIGVDVKTVSRYLRYFELSYQALLLPAWARNGQKRLSKSPKFHYLDNGVLQAVLQKRGGTTGNEFESLVVAEIYKQCRTAGTAASFYHLHTHDGFEIDLLIELPDGYIAFEIKQSERITSSDARHLKNLAPLLDKPLLQGFLVSNDRQMKELAPGITAVNAAWFLSGD